MTSKDICCVDALIAKAAAAVLEIQVIEARHIAESDDAAMTRMEVEMSASEVAARHAVDTLKACSRPQLDRNSPRPQPLSTGSRRSVPNS